LGAQRIFQKGRDSTLSWSLGKQSLVWRHQEGRLSIGRQHQALGEWNKTKREVGRQPKKVQFAVLPLAWWQQQLWWFLMLPIGSSHMVVWAGTQGGSEPWTKAEMLCLYPLPYFSKWFFKRNSWPFYSLISLVWG
jgi:hypothetical protein